MKIEKVVKRKNGGVSISYQDDSGQRFGLLLRPEQIVENYEAAQQKDAGAKVRVCPVCGSELTVKPNGALVG